MNVWLAWLAWLTLVFALAVLPSGRARMVPSETEWVSRTYRAIRGVGWLTAAFLLLALATGPEAKAEPVPPNCVQQLWWRGEAMRFVTRTICDGPIGADGSWLRARNFYGAPYYVPYTCSWGRYGGSCSGGYWRPEFDTGIEKYPVTPDTVLPDEPGHLGPVGGQVA